MVCDPATAMVRELRIAISQKLGETTNPKTVEELVDRYKKAYGILALQHPQLCLIDTTNLDEHAMVELVATKTLDTLEQKSILRLTQN